MYRIYYTHEGEITIVGASDQPGEYIECDLKTLEKIQASPHLYRIENKKIVEKTIEHKKRKKFCHTDSFPGWICVKDNLFNILAYVSNKPKWFDERKHSWVKYD